MYAKIPAFFLCNRKTRFLSFYISFTFIGMPRSFLRFIFTVYKEEFFICSAVLRIHSRENEVSTTGLLPSTTDLSRSLRLPRSFVTPYRMSYNPKRQASWFGLCSVSLAATQEIAFAFSSSRYLDVSVPWVCLPYPMYSDKDTIPLRMVGFPIRKSSDQSLLTAPRSISALVPSFIDS